MKKIKFHKESIGIILILVLSAILNFANISIEGTSNAYYAATVKSMTMSLKNFFFASFDPSGFITVDKPPLGFMIQAISAKIFGFSGWAILLPEALAGVISVYLVYYLVKRSFGRGAGLISAICLAVTPVFIATSRNNTIDNLLLVALLFGCVFLSKAAEKGKLKYLVIALVFVGIGFNIKMLEAYLVGPAFYITYLLASSINIKKRIVHLIVGTVVLVAVSFSWAFIVDLVPAKYRPYVGSSTNNSEIELIIGHNGSERLGLSGSSGMGGGAGQGGPSGEGGGFGGQQGGPGAQSSSELTTSQDGTAQPSGAPNGQNTQSGSISAAQDGSMSSPPSDPNGQNSQGGMTPPSGSAQGTTDSQNAQGGFGGPNDQNSQNSTSSNSQDGKGSMQGGPGGQGGQGGQSGQLQGSFGGQTTSGFARLFSYNMLSDQIVWFLPLAFLGFIAAAIKEKLRFKLDSKKKIALSLWILWLLPEFIYFSFTTGLFHPYYLTMMAAPAAALAGIGIKAMWDLYKEKNWKSWFLPGTLLIEAAVHGMMLYYFKSYTSTTIKGAIIVAIAVTSISAIALGVLNIIKINKENESLQVKKALVLAAVAGMLVTPFIGSSAAITHSVNSTIPAAGLELLSSGSESGDRGSFGGGSQMGEGGSDSKLAEFLTSNQTTEKYILVVSSSQSADSLIINNGLSVMALGGFSGSDSAITLDEFKQMVKNGEVRYVLTGGMGGAGGSSEIMNWVTSNGKLVSSSEYSDSSSNGTQSSAETTTAIKTATATTENSDNTQSDSSSFSKGGGQSSGQLYDLKGVLDSTN